MEMVANMMPRASGLGRACVEDICAKGGYVAILDMNEELGQEVVKEIGGGKTKFFEANVLETKSISAAVNGALAWSKETGKEIGGVVAAAGVSTPAKVSPVPLIIQHVSSNRFLQSYSSGIASKIYGLSRDRVQSSTGGWITAPVFFRELSLL